MLFTIYLACFACFCGSTSANDSTYFSWFWFNQSSPFRDDHCALHSHIESIAIEHPAMRSLHLLTLCGGKQRKKLFMYFQLISFAFNDIAKGMWNHYLLLQFIIMHCVPHQYSASTIQNHKVSDLCAKVLWKLKWNDKKWKFIWRVNANFIMR